MTDQKKAKTKPQTLEESAAQIVELLKRIADAIDPPGVKKSGGKKKMSITF